MRKHSSVHHETLQFTSSELRVTAPTRETDFEVQAFLWAHLRSRGLDARGEVDAEFGLSKRKKVAKCRFDIVIFDAGAAIWIIEIKPSTRTHKTVVQATRQGRRYACFGVPVTFIYGRSGAVSFAENLPEELLR